MLNFELTVHAFFVCKLTLAKLFSLCLYAQYRFGAPQKTKKIQGGPKYSTIFVRLFIKY